MSSSGTTRSPARFVAFVGMPNSGKDICSKYLEEHFKYISIRMSSIVVEEARKCTDKEPDRHQLQELGAELRRQYGNGVIARRIVDDLVPRITMNIKKESENPQTVFDEKKLHFVFNGVRSKGEVEVFKKEYGGDFLLIAMCSSFETRYKRAMIRKRIGFDNFDREQFRKLDDAELALGLGDAIALADRYIVNEGTIVEMLNQVKKLIFP